MFYLSAVLSFVKKLGPGLLYAGAAIGVSHIVQSTRAGAEFGYVLILAIVLAHLFKYPFFALGPRYANLSGEHLITGFSKLNGWAIYLLLGLTLATMFTIQAAVTVVTAGLAQEITGIVMSPWIWSAILLIICALILRIGHYRFLDNFMKVIMVLLACSTLAAMAFSFEVQKPIGTSEGFDITNPLHIAFLVAFIGWMPAPLDISIWHSLWTKTKNQTQGKIDLKTENLDFKTGFFGTAILAICFLMLGANTLYGTGIALESSAGAFAKQLIDIYTQSLGSWAYWIIGLAAFTTMFSTTLTCFDALPRVMQAIGQESKQKAVFSKRWLWMLVLALGTVVILAFFVSNMKQMVTVATVVSFLTAPLIAYLAILLVRRSPFGSKIWNSTESMLALVGLFFLSVFSIYYLYTLL